MAGLDYAQRLKELMIYNIQRSHWRLKIIYLYKIKEKLVPNISSTNGLTFSIHGRHGCRCDVPNFPLRRRTRKARE